jgi:ferredoxin
MTYVVTAACIRCKYTDCVDVCPVDCFREGANMLVIEPSECIDCAVCVPECPVDAIVPDTDPRAQAWLERNASLASQWPVITRSIPAPADADAWKDIDDKDGELDPSPAAR